MTLAGVTRAARARLRAEETYRSVIVTAAKRHSHADIARAAGVSRQAVRQLLLRGARKG